MEAHIIKFAKHGDVRGALVVVEGIKDIPFEIKRIFYIYDSDSTVVRGQHANRKSEFLLVCVSGSCKVKTDDGRGKQDIFTLNNPNEGLYIPKLVWKDMYEFSSDCVLLCLSSENYDANEYIRDFQVFLNEMGE